MMRCVLPVLALLLFSPPACPADEALALLDGVRQIVAPGIPGPLVVAGPNAFPVVAGGSGRHREPVVAAGAAGRGRVVAFGHPGYFEAEAVADAGTARLLANGVRWASGNAAGASRVGVRGAPALLAALRAAGWDARPLDGADWLRQLPAHRVLCWRPDTAAERVLGPVRRWLQSGGGLVTAELGWGWLQLHPGRTLRDIPANRLLAEAGVQWADGYLAPTAPGGYDAATPPPVTCHAGKALRAVSAARGEGASADLEQASVTLTRAVVTLPRDDRFVRPGLAALRRRTAGAIVPTEKSPLTAKQPVERLLLAMDLHELREATPERVRAHPAAVAFPGAVPDSAPRVRRELAVSLARGGWQSTGLYAAPGERITVTVPAGAEGLTLRIGAHTDALWDADSWRRAPEISRAWALRGGTQTVASAFGGAIYIECAARSGPSGLAKIAISNAVEAPLYVLGSTSLDEWRSRQRGLPAPWAELVSSKVCLTVPSRAVRDLQDPEALMRFWESVVDACATLAAWPLERRTPERYVADVQISAGYMHSGYPIMTHLDAAPLMVNREAMLAAREPTWGLFHEMGHNHQSGDWTFEGMTEVTVNLFTLYVLDRVCGIGSQARRETTREVRERKVSAYLAKGPDYSRLVADPFLALIHYEQIREAFGWEAFRDVFAEYRALPAAERPRTEQQKRDQWALRLSRRVGRNLGPFLVAWGVPVTAEALRSLEGLPAWMPEGFPASGSVARWATSRAHGRGIALPSRGCWSRCLKARSPTWPRHGSGAPGPTSPMCTPAVGPGSRRRRPRSPPPFQPWGGRRRRTCAS